MTRDDAKTAADAELQVLSAAMLDNGVVFRCAAILDGVPWSCSARGAVWAKMVEMSQSERVTPIDALSLSQVLAPKTLAAI